MHILYALSKATKGFIRTMRIALTPKPETIRDRTVNSVYYMLKDYSDWYQEAGIVLPPDYETDPSAWNEELHKMVRAFKLVHDNMHGRGELYDALHNWEFLDKIDTVKLNALNKEIQEGFEAFGKQLQHLTDPEGEYPQPH
jgi:hypothetical protein